MRHHDFFFHRAHVPGPDEWYWSNLEKLSFQGTMSGSELNLSAADCHLCWDATVMGGISTATAQMTVRGRKRREIPATEQRPLHVLAGCQDGTYRAESTRLVNRMACNCEENLSTLHNVPQARG